MTKPDPDFIGTGNIGQTNANIASNSTLGGSTIQIRGLPTLVLMEDRRFADSAAIATGSQFKDVSLFPVALVSRIEVLKDGASSLYGSDAVGGVVNVFLRDDFTGLEIGYRYGFSVEPGVAERRGYLIAGAGDDKTHVVAAFQYYEIDPLFTRERRYSAFPGLGLNSGVTTTYGGTGRDNAGGHTSFYLLQGLVPSNWPAGPSVNSPLDFYAAHSIAPPPPVGANPGQYAQMPNAYMPASVAEITSYNLTLRPTSTLLEQNTDAYASFTDKICGDQLEAFGNFLFAHNHNESFLNAQPLSNGTGVIILGSERVDPVTGQLVPENRGPPAPYNPFQLSIDSNTLSGRFRLFANNRYQSSFIGADPRRPRRFTNDTDFYRALGGLKSQINKDWYVEGAAYYSHDSIYSVSHDLVIANRLNQLIGLQDANGNGIPGQTLDFFAFDPVHDGPRSIDPNVFKSILGNDIRTQDSYERAFDAHVTGNVINLPGGPIGVAFGVDYTVEGFKIFDSPEIFVGSVPVGEIDTGRNIFGAYGEIRIPVVGSEMNVPWLYSMDIGLSGRYTVYEGISGDSKTPKVTLRVQPIKDLTLRGTFSNSFIAPNLFQLFGPTATGFSETISFHGETEDQAQVSTGSNPHLVPSTAQNWTAGLVYSPHYIPGLTITADYFWTLQQLIVGTLGGAKILNSVENLGPASPFANLVAFGNFPGQPGSRPVTAPGQLQGNLASVFYLDNELNLGADRVSGVDLSASYLLDLQQWGQVQFQIASVVFIGHDQRTTPFDPYYNISGLIGTESFGAYPDYKISALLEHRWKGFTLSLNANYLPSFKNIVGSDPSTVDQSTLMDVEDYVTVDGRLSYAFHFAEPEAAAPPAPMGKDGKTTVESKGVPGVEARSCWSYQNWLDGVTLTVGCNNMLDEDPRLIVGGNSATNLATYDPFGRFVYFEVSKKF